LNSVVEFPYAAATLAGQLAELVYALCARAGLTQTELARRMGTTQSSVARIESGGSLPALDILARIAHATGSALRIAAPGISDVDLGGAASEATDSGALAGEPVWRDVTSPVYGAKKLHLQEPSP